MVFSESFKNEIEKSGANVLYNEPMKNHTSFKVGGRADALCITGDKAAIGKIIAACKKSDVPYYIIGNATNVLFPDEDTDGVVISVCDPDYECTREGETVFASAGAILSKTAVFAMNNSLSGMEPISGIFGTVGGAIVMNAGAYGREIADITEKVYYIDESGNEGCFSKDECNFGYRRSVFTDSKLIVTGAVFRLEEADRESIREGMNEFKKRRMEKQPLSYPSCGSTFKRPEGYFAGALIEEAGLKGYSIGGAKVSEKHAGFVINTGDAAAKDITALISHIKKTVFEKSGVMLECEIKMLSDLKRG